MLIYEDSITGDELISDAYDINVVDGVAFEVDASQIVIKKGADIDIGANPSAEEAGEDLEDGSETVLNIVHSFRLQPTSFDKKTYLTYLKSYMKAVKAKIEDPEEATAFEKGAQAYAKKIVAKFKDFEFYTGESMNPDGMIVLGNWREDGTTPYFIFWKHGLKEVKV